MLLIKFFFPRYTVIEDFPDYELRPFAPLDVYVGITFEEFQKKPVLKKTNLAQYAINFLAEDFKVYRGWALAYWLFSILLAIIVRFLPFKLNALVDMGLVFFLVIFYGYVTKILPYNFVCLSDLKQRKLKLPTGQTIDISQIQDGVIFADGDCLIRVGGRKSICYLVGKDYFQDETKELFTFVLLTLNRQKKLLEELNVSSLKN